MELGRQHQQPPALASRPTDIGSGYVSANGREIPAHVRVTWRDRDGVETTEWVWGMVTSWSEAAMHFQMWRHGQWEVWVRREDVEPCTCTEVHEPGWWPAPDETTALDGE